MWNRRKFIKSISTASLALGMPLSINAEDKNNKLVILHTNDTHSRIEPFPNNNSRNPGLGGYAKRADILAQIRQQESHVLLLDAGDIWQGTPYFNYYKGELEIRLMSRLGYDAMTIGNHEFDNGTTIMGQQFKKASFPIVSTNYQFLSGPLKEVVKPYHIIKKGPFKIGLLGAGVNPEGLIDPCNTDGLKYHDPIGIINEKAAFLKNSENCDLVICISHLGLEFKGKQPSDTLLAQQSSDLDIIIGGHTHTLLKEARRVKNKNGKEIIIGQVGYGGAYLGRMDISFGEASSPKSAALQV